MKIKRYLDTDMRNVLKRVREDQGPDAVILSNRRVDEGIEVITALDYDEALIRQALGVHEAVDAKISSEALARIAEDDVPTAAPAPPAAAKEAAVHDRARVADDRGLGKMETELALLRNLLESQVSGLVWKETTRSSPLRAQILRNLAMLGLAPDIAHRVVDRLEPLADIRSVWQAPLAELAQLVPVGEDDLLVKGGVCALIGPTGVGKTTTIAKIAAHYAMHHYADDIALVSADAFRIGAREHLAAFANILGVKVHTAGSSQELAELLTRLQDKRLVLIDTEGRSPRDRQLTNRLAAYGSNRDRIRFYLTLSAATQEAGLEEAIREFGKVPIDGCILTKIDEAGQLGCAIGSLIRNDMRVAWFADGQRIPEDLHPAASKKLWLIHQAIECIDNSRPAVDERVMAERYVRAGTASA